MEGSEYLRPIRRLGLLAGEFEVGLEGLCLLDVEDGVVRVRGGLVLRGITDEALLVGEGDVGGSDTVTCGGPVSSCRGDTDSSIGLTLVVDENLNLALGHDTNARVGTAFGVSMPDRGKGKRQVAVWYLRSKIDTNDSAVVVGIISRDGLDESQRGEEEANPGQEGEAHGDRVPGSRHGVQEVAATSLLARAKGNGYNENGGRKGS